MTVRGSFGLMIGLIIGMYWSSMPVTAAEVWLDTQHINWQTAGEINSASGEYIMFARLRQTGEARWVRWNVKAGERVEIEIAVPLKSDARFQPTLVIFEPDTQTVGPVLPFEQPADTLASVYPSQPARRQFEGLTQARLAVRFRDSLIFESSGQTFLAVYNASAIPGSFRLIIRTGSGSLTQAAIVYPKRWWYTQAWAGWSLDSAFLPAGLIGLIVGGRWINYRSKRKPLKIKSR